MTAGFETENLIFVPAGQEFTIVDLVGWKTVRLDSLACYVKLRETALARVQAESQRLLQQAEKRKSPKLAEWKEILDSLTFDLSAWDGPDATAARTLGEVVPGLSGWVRLTDKPEETFFPEDYEEARPHHGDAEAFPVYGSVGVSRMDDLEIPLPGHGPDAPMWLVAPAGSLRVEALDPLDALPLVGEYCGVGGVSSRGVTVNFHHGGAVSPEHTVCTPLRRLGDGLFATLYVHFTAEFEKPMTLSLSPRQLDKLGEVLARSRFDVVSRTDNWAILRRDEDVVHYYTGLPGLESAGALTIPPFLLVARAGGSADPAARAGLAGDLAAVLD